MRRSVGEVKSYTSLDKGAINEAYLNLKSLSENKKLSVLFHFAKEYLSLQNNKEQKKNIDRHMVNSIPKRCLLLSLTQSKPIDPFSNIPQSNNFQIMAVHIQLESIRSFLPYLFE